MPRPNLPKDLKRNKHFAVYLTEPEEKELLQLIESIPGMSRTKCGQEALRLWKDSLLNIPPQIAASRVGKHIESDNVLAAGYNCSNGHAFWIPITWATPPTNCPCCGSQSISKLWNGRIKKGFE
jgi:hypothetical protein